MCLDKEPGQTTARLPEFPGALFEERLQLLLVDLHRTLCK